MIFDIDTTIVELSVVAPSEIVATASVVLPVVVIRDKGLIYRGFTTPIDGSNDTLMIDGTAPYGSSEDDAVWTVYINPLDEYGNVVEEEIEVLENQIWSEIKNMYN